jgi:hypothetical protein
MVVRNESLRLPFMLNHYLSNGVDRIFILDNDSSDESSTIVLSHQNTHLFNVHDDYVNQAAWVDVLLRRYGTGCWCLVVDADEILIYPDFERISLRAFCNSLDLASFDALDCVLLDMYPEGRLSEVEYERGTDPLLIAPCFDRSSYTDAPWFGGSSCADGGTVSHYIHHMNLFYRGPSRLVGGMRKRVFNVDACISKFPLVKFKKRMYLCPGTHFVQNARIADLRGVLLHFKYLNDFTQNIASEVARVQRAHGNELEYKEYLTVLNSRPDLSLFCSDSTRFSGSSQLVQLGLMKRSSRIVTSRIEGLQVSQISK